MGCWLLVVGCWLWLVVVDVVGVVGVRCCLLVAVCWSVVWCLLFVACWLLFAGCCLSVVVGSLVVGCWW